MTYSQDIFLFHRAGFILSSFEGEGLCQQDCFSFEGNLTIWEVAWK